MNELKNFLVEKNISVKEFSRITKVKEKKLSRVLDNQAFFSGDEANRVSAFLGVSKNELYHGVVERKGELLEVAEQNNLNHFCYYIKNRFKTKRKVQRFLESLLWLSSGGLIVFYVAAMFLGVTGLPTILRSVDVMLCCLILPLIGMFSVQDYAFEKIYKKKSVKENTLKKECMTLSIVVLLFGVFSFINEFVPVPVLLCLIASAHSLLLLSFIPVFKNKAFVNGFVRFVVYSVPAMFMVAASGLFEFYLNENLPEDIMSDSSAFPMVFVGLMLFWLIYGLFIFALKQTDNVFIEGVGNLITPIKKEKTITKKRFGVTLVFYVLLACVLFLGILASQGIYLKYMYTNLFNGKEETVNWTSEFITDYDSQYKKGEYDVVKFDGVKIRMPDGYSLDKKTEYTTIYKKSEEESIIFSKPIDATQVDMDLFGEDFGEGKITEKQKEKLKQDFIKYFGFYPQNMYEWHKLMGIVTLNDVDIFNPRKTALLSTALIMKSVAGIPDSEYYLYENGELYANINIHTVQNKEKGDREIVNINFGTPDLEYSFSLIQPDQDNDVTIEEVTKILNSINLR